MALSKELIERVRQAADIVQVVGQSVALKETGNHFSGLCPFHREKSPSFKVFPETQHFHCFGCGEGGSVFDFLMKVDGIPFAEAVEELAERLGIALPKSPVDDAARQAEGEVLETLELAARYYVAELGRPRGAEARKYLALRGLTEDTIKRYRIGYAPPGWDSLLEGLARQRGGEALARAGLAVRARGANRYYDRFRNRIVFPIVAASGPIVGFGGRAMGEDTPKYLNTPETAVYHKSRVLYGLREAKTEIRRLRRVLVVEGYMDVLGLHQAGIVSAVATCGTAMSAEHARALARLAPEIVCVFDGDAAGARAALRAFETLLPTGALVRAVAMPENKDPDDLVREGGAAAFDAVLEARTDVVEFFYERTKGEPRPAALQRLSQLIALVPDAIVRQELIGRAADWFKFDEATFRSSVDRQPASPARRAPIADEPRAARPSGELPRGLEADLLRIVFLDPPFAKIIEELMNRAEIGRFIEARVRPPALWLVREIAGGRLSLATLREGTDDPGLARFASAVEAEGVVSEDVLERLEHDLVRRLPLLALEAERDRLRRALGEASRRGDGESERKLLARLRDIGRQLNELAQGEPSSSSA